MIKYSIPTIGQIKWRERFKMLGCNTSHPYVGSYIVCLFWWRIKCYTYQFYHISLRETWAITRLSEWQWNNPNAYGKCIAWIHWAVNDEMIITNHRIRMKLYEAIRLYWAVVSYCRLFNPTDDSHVQVGIKIVSSCDVCQLPSLNIFVVSEWPRNIPHSPDWIHI